LIVPIAGETDQLTPCGAPITLAWKKIPWPGDSVADVGYTKTDAPAWPCPFARSEIWAVAVELGFRLLTAVTVTICEVVIVSGAI
jgi:hypothetical protein